MLRLSRRTHRPLVLVAAVPLMLALSSCGSTLPPGSVDDGDEDTSDDSNGTDTTLGEDRGPSARSDLELFSARTVLGDDTALKNQREDSCDPLKPNCPESTSCYWTGTEFACVFVTKDIPPGGECGYANDCLAPALCVTAPALPDCKSEYCCAPFCNVNSSHDPCGALLTGTECISFFVPGTAPESQEHIGVCALPPPSVDSHE